MSVVVVIPSRGRPFRALEAVLAIRATAARTDTSVILAVDADDPLRSEYYRMIGAHWSTYGPEVTLVTLDPDETGDLVRATNTVSLRVARDDPTAIIGNLGDDHRTRTYGWDRRVLEVLAEPGIAYGDDRIQGERLPTAPFISASIVNALGWYALPTCRHLFIDDAWKALGLGIDALRYLPDVVIEHEHPAGGKVEWDDGYRLANSEARLVADRDAYHEWRNTTYYADVDNIKRAIRR